MSASSKSIEDLCKIQAKYAKSGHWLFDQADDRVFEYIGQNKAVVYVLDTKESIIKYLQSLLLYERAYRLVESCALNFSTVFRFEDWNEHYKCLKGPVNHCSHYGRCKVRIHGPEHSLEITGRLASQGDKLLVDINWPDKHKLRLSGKKAICKVVQDGNYFYERHSLRNLQTVLTTTGNIDKNNPDLIKMIFNHHQRLRRPKTNAGSNVALPSTDGATRFEKRSLIKAVMAKSQFTVTIPFIIVNFTWTNELAWLQNLMTTLNAINSSKIGILCPTGQVSREISELFKSFESISVLKSSAATKRIIKPKLDYFIIYRAHSIGVTEAISWMSGVKHDGCVMLIGDPRMPNLRIHNQQVRKACGSVINWFYNRERYPEYFEKNSRYIIHNPVCLDYNPVIFSFINQVFYDGELINPFELDTDPVAVPLIFMPVKGSAVVLGCSPYNEAEICCCMESVKRMVEAGVDQYRIGVLTTYCAQKKQIKERCKQSYGQVFVGILQDFVDIILDYLVISTTETAQRTSGGKRYLFSDLLYDKLSLNLALTRGRSQIVVVGDEDVLKELPHWNMLIDLCERQDGKGFKSEHKVKQEPTD